MCESDAKERLLNGVRTGMADGMKNTTKKNLWNNC